MTADANDARLAAIRRVAHNRFDLSPGEGLFLFDVIDRQRVELDRLHALIDPDVTVRDLEMKMRDGTIDVSMGLGPGMEGPVRYIAALALHLVLGEDGEMPTNYRWAELLAKPANEHPGYRIGIEARPDGRPSSHELRRSAEAERDRLSAELERVRAVVLEWYDAGVDYMHALARRGTDRAGREAAIDAALARLNPAVEALNEWARTHRT